MEGVEDACALLTVTFCMCSTTARVGLCSQHESDSAASTHVHIALHILHCTYTVCACAISRIAWDYKDRRGFSTQSAAARALGTMGNVRERRLRAGGRRSSCAARDGCGAAHDVHDSSTRNVQQRL